MTTITIAADSTAESTGKLKRELKAAEAKKRAMALLLIVPLAIFLLIIYVVPIGALLTRKNIFDKIFNQMDRAVVHGSTFAKNDLAMAAGIATLDVIKNEKLVEQAAKRGAELQMALTRLVPSYELLKEVRGKGLMLGVEFGPPKSLRLRASWNVLETANKGLFCQLITVPLFKDHKILTQVAGHGSHTIKLLPPLTITEDDCNWIAKSFDEVIAASHKVPGAIWSLGKTLVDNAVRKSA